MVAGECLGSWEFLLVFGRKQKTAGEGKEFLSIPLAAAPLDSIIGVSLLRAHAELLERLSPSMERRHACMEEDLELVEGFLLILLGNPLLIELGPIPDPTERFFGELLPSLSEFCGESKPFGQ